MVIEGDGPGLFGRDLIQLLEVNLGEGICLNSITNFKTEMERKFPTLFSPGLGCYSGVKFSLTVDPAIPPIYCKSRPLPYTLKPKVNIELDKLLDAGVIEPIVQDRAAKLGLT